MKSIAELAQLENDPNVEEVKVVSLNHGITQANLTTLCSHDERFRVITELSLDVSQIDLNQFGLKVKDELILDVCLYLRKQRLTQGDDILKMSQMPLLIIEILSPKALSDILFKFKAYFALGIKSCWLVTDVTQFPKNFGILSNMKPNYLDLYTNYLSVTFGYATSTGLSNLLDGKVSHDQVTRALSSQACTSKDLWLPVKPTLRQVESEEGCLIFDDSIVEKPWRDENELIGWHYDHSKGRHVKGINLLNCLYHIEKTSIPIAFELIHKPLVYCDIKTRQETCLSEITKNELMRNRFDTGVQNAVKFHWVLFDSWFSSAENMAHIKFEPNKEFIGALKSNRLVALREEDKAQGRFTRWDQLQWSEQQAIYGWLKGMAFPVQLAHQVFTNPDGSYGILYLACSQLKADWNTITTIYQQRWQVEVFHKSLKSNAAVAKSPARRLVSQANHVLASLVAVFKMEQLKMRTKLNHFALKSRLYLNAVRAAYDELQILRAA